MNQWMLYHGKRIRPSDKNLVVKIVLGIVMLPFFCISISFNIQRLLKWIDSGFKDGRSIFLTPSVLFSMIVGLCVGFLLLFVIIRCMPDGIKRLQHRQSLARMILHSGWYESKKVQTSSLMKDASSSSKDKIVWFPKMYYRMCDGELHITVMVDMGKYQKQLLHLEEKLESGLYCELVDRELCESRRGAYVKYRLLYDMIANRISIDEVSAKNGCLRLMKNMWWEYDNLPHMLIAGGTGGGKSYFILTIIEVLMRTDSFLYILDPKNADLSDLGVVLPDVYYQKEDMIACLDRFFDLMMERQEQMKHMPEYKTGMNYSALGLPAHFLIFDEYVAFMEMLGSKENAGVLSRLKQIVMLGRQAGFFLILACQRPDAKYLGDGIRDQFHFRVALGRMSELGYSMMFGDTKKEFFMKRIKGRGYVDTGNSAISEFYTPLVPKGHDFIRVIGELQQARIRSENTVTIQADD